MNPSAVSVVIDTYNYGRFVEAAIDSVLAQDFPKEQMEIIVVDDGSTDDTAERVRKYGDALKYFRKENGGQASAFNFGIAKAKGEIIAFLDGDDVWMPSKLSRVVAEFDRNPDAVMVYHYYQFWDPDANWAWKPGIAPVSGNVLAERAKVLDYSGAPTSSIAFRRRVLDRILPVPESLRFMADGYLVGTAIFLGAVGFVPECLAKNRVHGGNLWFAERSQPSREHLQRRAGMRREVTKVLRHWVKSNAPRASRNARAYLCTWDLLGDSEESQLRPLVRWRQAVHLCREALAVRPIVSRRNVAYRFVKAAAVLVVGRRAERLEHVRARLTRGSAPTPVEANKIGRTTGQT